MQPYQKNKFYVLPIVVKNWGMGILIAPVHKSKNAMS